MKNKVIIAGLACAVSLAVHATDNPPSGEIVNYDGSAAPGPVSGSIGFDSPDDNYDWWCASVTSGQQVDIDLTRDSGDLLLNGGVYEEVVPEGSTVGDFTTSDVADTSNSSSPDVSFSFTPASTGVATIWVSTFLGEDGGDYTLTVSGATAASCGTSGPAAAIPTMPSSLIALLAALIGVFGVIAFRRRLYS